ncbi:hypothetical protein VP01_35g2 [Puccinia sorghi]|uniref:Uncharacterized protein n=1 Tax=Puccinia sorghi TaxID=27349 RepID=A0A0L6UV27_9BASI|nr:hypothetical protein VP01_35g2 [Puccinia sorghi]
MGWSGGQQGMAVLSTSCPSTTHTRSSGNRTLGQCTENLTKDFGDICPCHTRSEHLVLVSITAGPLRAWVDLDVPCVLVLTLFLRSRGFLDPHRCLSCSQSQRHFDLIYKFTTFFLLKEGGAFFWGFPFFGGLIASQTFLCLSLVLKQVFHGSKKSGMKFGQNPLFFLIPPPHFWERSFPVWNLLPLQMMDQQPSASESNFVLMMSYLCCLDSRNDIPLATSAAKMINIKENIYYWDSEESIRFSEKVKSQNLIENIGCIYFNSHSVVSPFLIQLYCCFLPCGLLSLIHFTQSCPNTLGWKPSDIKEMLKKENEEGHESKGVEGQELYLMIISSRTILTQKDQGKCKCGWRSWIVRLDTICDDWWKVMDQLDTGNDLRKYLKERRRQPFKIGLYFESVVTYGAMWCVTCYGLLCGLWCNCNIYVCGVMWHIGCYKDIWQFYGRCHKFHFYISVYFFTVGVDPVYFNFNFHCCNDISIIFKLFIVFYAIFLILLCCLVSEYYQAENLNHLLNPLFIRRDCGRLVFLWGPKKRDSGWESCLFILKSERFFFCRGTPCSSSLHRGSGLKPQGCENLAITCIYCCAPCIPAYIYVLDDRLHQKVFNPEFGALGLSFHTSFLPLITAIPSFQYSNPIRHIDTKHSLLNTYSLPL